MPRNLDEDRAGWGPEGQSVEKNPLSKDERGHMATDDVARAQISALAARVTPLEAWRTSATASLSSQGTRATAVEADLSDHEVRLVVLEGGPPPGTDHVCTTALQFTTALTVADPGDTITLTAGATYDGSFTLGNRGASAATPITIRTSAYASLPNRRITTSDVSLLAKVRATSVNSPAFLTADNGDGWTLLGLEITASVAQAGALVEIGQGAETVAANQPDGITIDRCYLHGANGLGVVRGVVANGANIIVRRCRIEQIWNVGQECQAILIWNGPGPLLVEDNYLSAMGEVFMSGGADAAIMNLVPSDLTFRSNTFQPPYSQNQNHPTYSVDYGVHKNVFELKNARNVLIELNTFENSWEDGQDGAALVFTVRNQNGGNTWATIEDVTFRKNVIFNVKTAFRFLTQDDTFTSENMKRVRIEHNLVYDVDWPYGGSGSVSKHVLISTGGGEGSDTLEFEHNTFASASGFATPLLLAPSGSLSGAQLHSAFMFRNNVTQINTSDGDYGIFRDGGTAGAAALNGACAVGYAVTHNLFYGGDIDTAAYPANTWEEAVAATDVGFDNYAAHDLELTGAGASGDYRAGGDRDATDGTALGVQWSLISGLL